MSMMGVKRGTQAFSKAEQTSNLKNDDLNNLSASDQAKFFGEQSLGDVLNKVADPNYVNKAKMRSVGNNQLDKDAFMKLMLAQMKNQDPTNPMQSHEMAAQLAQFTSLEQLNNINSTLGDIKNAQSPSTNYQALALIGKKVSGDSSKLTRAGGDTKHELSFDLMNDTAKVNVTIKDATGAVVRKLEVANLKKGANSIEWNGVGEDGLAARAGEYKISVEGVAANGQKIYAKTSFEGRITGLNYTPEGPILIVGKQTVKLSDVKKIEDPNAADDANTAATPLGAGAMLSPKQRAMLEAMSASGAGATATNGPQKAAGQSKAANSSATGDQKTSSDEENIPPAPESDETMVGNINDVPMERGLLDKVAKVTK